MTFIDRADPKRSADSSASRPARTGVAGDVAAAVAVSRSLHKLDEHGLTLTQRKAKVLRAIEAVSGRKDGD